MLLVASLSVVLTACGANTSAVESQPQTTEEKVEEPEAEAEEPEEVSDEEAAAHVAELIDAIYVQTRTDETDAQCEEAKKAWDALTDAQKELVEGEEADPDYFGRDTGDASLDDPLNADDIGENEILVVSFGTSFNDSRAKDIGGIEKAIAEAFPEYSVRRAFTAQIIINHVQARDGEKIDNVDQALERAVNNGVKNLIVQPTHLMHGAEYDELMESVDKYADKFENVIVSEPLLGEVGADEKEVNADKEAVAEAVVAEAIKDAGFSDIDEAQEASTAFVFLGHGTSHKAKVTYSQMSTMMSELNYSNVFIGTVEGEPEETEVEAVIDAIADDGYKKVILRPLMVVAGDHANNDMAGDDEDSWKSLFEARDVFENVDCQISGLGRIEDIQNIYINHLEDALKKNDISVGGASSSKSEALEDGEYIAKFDTDSGMFHVNETLDGKGTLTVKDGEMSIYVVLAGDGILNLYPGVATDAEKDEDNLLQPEKVTVKYDDGEEEEVFAFTVPVPALDEEFDLALIGKKGKWYDHKVKVSDPEKK